MKLEQAVVLVTEKEILVLDSETGARLTKFSDNANSSAVVLVPRYYGTGFQGILIPPIVLSAQSDQAVLNSWSWAKVVFPDSLLTI